MHLVSADPRLVLSVSWEEMAAAHWDVCETQACAAVAADWSVPSAAGSSRVQPALLGLSSCSLGHCCSLSAQCPPAVPAPLGGSHPHHRGRRLQGARARPDCQGDRAHVWGSHQQSEADCHGSHVAKHLLECSRRWLNQV